MRLNRSNRSDRRVTYDVSRISDILNLVVGKRTSTQRVEYSLIVLKLYYRDSCDAVDNLRTNNNRLTLP